MSDISPERFPWALLLMLFCSAFLTCDSTGSPSRTRVQVKVPSEFTLQQGAAHHRDEIKSPAVVKCSSCGKTSPDSSFQPVHYKTVIAHFEQVKAHIIYGLRELVVVGYSIDI